MCSRSPSIISFKTAERFVLELKKSSGSLGISVAVRETFQLSDLAKKSLLSKRNQLLLGLIWKTEIQKFNNLEDFGHFYLL